MSNYYTSAVRLGRMNAVTAQAGATAVLEIGTAAMAAVLATFPLNNPIAPTAVGIGVLTLSGFPKSATVMAGGTAAAARIRTATGGTDIVTGLTVGLSGTYDIVLGRLGLNAGETIRLDGVTIAFDRPACGANLSGMEWTSGIRYNASSYPNINITVPRSQDIAYLASTGMSKSRLAIAWEMLQPVLATSLAGAAVRSAFGISANGDFYATYRDYITAMLDAHAAVGMTMILDLHNYCRYRDFVYNADGTVTGFVDPADPLTQPYTTDTTKVTERIFSNAAGATLTIANFNDFWARAAAYWGVNWNGTGLPHPGLGGYGLMNEPNTMPAVGQIVAGGSEDYTIWPTYAQAAITAIRAIDPTTPIYIAGNSWSNAQSWAALNPGYPLTGTNLVYEAHCYLDFPGTGASFDWTIESAQGATVNDGYNRILPFRDWGAAYGVALAIGEIGMPTGNANWTQSFHLAAQLCADNDIELFSWMGGNHWPIHGKPVTHAPQWHQNKTLEPEVGGEIKRVLGVAQATLFDDGPGYWVSGNPIAITVYARGNLLTPITLSVGSNNGGTFSKQTLTLAAGANSTDSYTFTPGIDLVTNLVYQVTSADNIAAPPTRVVYSITDPIALAASDIPTAAKTLIAKYSLCKWVASDAYTDYMGGVPSTNAAEVRAIADSGYGSTYNNPMEMINWLNAGSGMGTVAIPPLATDGNSKKYVDYSVAGRRSLWCKKMTPEAVDDPNPVSRMPFDMNTPHVVIAAVAITTGGTNGKIFQAGTAENSGRSELYFSAGVPTAHMEDNASHSVTLGGVTALSTNTPTVVTLRNKPSAQSLRVQSVVKASGTSAWSATNTFNQMLIAGGYDNYYPSDSFLGRVYAMLAGPGDPSNNEVGILETYASSLAGGSLTFTPEASGGGGGGGTGYLFGARLDPYNVGVIHPTQSSATMDTVCKNSWNGLKANHYVTANNIVAGGWIVKKDATYTVSEGMGYGMLLSVLFAGYDANAKTMFDGLLAVVRARPAYSMAYGQYLMDWRILNSSGASAGGGYCALDADLDIAMALLMAHRQWGSAGTWNYQAQAIGTINAMKADLFKTDGTTKGLPNSTTSRTSDYMIGHFKAFKKATGDAFWDIAISRAYDLMNLMQTASSGVVAGWPTAIRNEYTVPGVGLIPDFIVNTNGELGSGGPYPSIGGYGFGDGSDSPSNNVSNKYFYNACRIPWRLASDYALTGDTRSKTVCDRITTFFKNAVVAAGNDVTTIGFSYNLQGTRLGWSAAWNDDVFMGPIFAGTILDSSYQTFCDQMYAWNSSHIGASYYSEIQLFCMIVASGNWWTP